MDRGAWRATVHGFARVGHDLVTKLPSPEGLGASSCGHSHGGGPGQGGLQPSLCQHLRMGGPAQPVGTAVTSCLVICRQFLVATRSDAFQTHLLS